MTAAHLMTRAVDFCTAHVEAGGLPFVGVVVNADGVAISGFGVNRVAETGDPMAHAEVVAIREAMAGSDLTTLAGCTLLATGEPCGLCYRYAIERGIDAILVAIDRDEVAGFGFDYRASYAAFGITEAQRADLFHPLRVAHGDTPFTRYLHLRHPAHPTSKGTST